jgi:hypothetical protein
VIVANSTLKIAIVAVDKASKELSKVAGAADKMGKAGLIAAGGIAAFGASSVKAYSEAEAAQAKLQDTFDKFPRLADVSIDSLRDYNAELQKKTRFDDDAIASGQAILGQYEITGKQLQELTPLIADFAAKTGQSFEEASAAVGKGLLGSGKAFKQIGLDFKDTGTQAGNLEQIMGGLRTQVGGFAEQEANTGAGAAARLSNQFGELQESVGKELLPPLVALAGITTDVLGAFNGLPTPVRNTALAVGVLGTAALIAAPKILALKQLLATSGGKEGAGKFAGGLKGAAGMLGGPWGIAIAGGIAALGYFASAQAASKARTQELTAALEADTGAIGENVRATIVARLEKDGLLKKAQQLGISTATLTNAVLGEKAAITEVNAKLGDYDTRLGRSTKAGVGAGGQAKKNAAAARDLRDAVAGGNAELNESVASFNRQKQAMDQSTRAARRAKVSIADLNAEIASLNALAAGATPGSGASARIAEERSKVAGEIAGRRANGGPVGAGKTYLVGERGPELFTATSNGMIIPNGGSRSVGGPAVMVNVYGSALASKQEIARVVTDALRSSGARGLATA